jgi:hypothetical protein
VCNILVERVNRQPGEVVKNYAKDPLRYKFRGDDNWNSDNTSVDFLGMGQELFASLSFMSAYAIALAERDQGWTLGSLLPSRKSLSTPSTQH